MTAGGDDPGTLAIAAVSPASNSQAKDFHSTDHTRQAPSGSYSARGMRDREEGDAQDQADRVQIDQHLRSWWALCGLAVGGRVGASFHTVKVHHSINKLRVRRDLCYMYGIL